jgi:hypothetical protein
MRKHLSYLQKFSLNFVVAEIGAVGVTTAFGASPAVVVGAALAVLVLWLGALPSALRRNRERSSR